MSQKTVATINYPCANLDETLLVTGAQGHKISNVVINQLATRHYISSTLYHIIYGYEYMKKAFKFESGLQ